MAQLSMQAAIAEPTDGFAWFDAGIADDGLGRKADAVKAYEKAFSLLTGYARDGVVQLLAQDYAALDQSDKLRAFYGQLQKTDPQAALALKSQFSAVIENGAGPATAAGGAPDVSPQSLAALEARVRRSWQSDAVPVRVTVDALDNGGFQTEFDFYSPSTRSGLSVALSPSTSTAKPAPNPSWGTVPLPDDFLPLATALTRVSGGLSPEALEIAYLDRQFGDPSDPLDLVWSIALKAANTDDVVLPAYVMSQDEFARLQTAAGGGDAKAQYALAQVYANGIVGTPDLEQAAAWLKKAVARGDSAPENKLGQFFQLGLGMPANASTAAQWYQKAANSGFAPAQFNLGLLYETGLGVNQDWPQADRWITAAAKQGLEPAVLELGFVHQTAKRALHAREVAAEQQRMAVAGQRVIFGPLAAREVQMHQYFDTVTTHPELQGMPKPWE